MKLENVKPETIIRTVCLLLTMINAGLEIFGKSPLPISDETVRQTVTFIIVFASAIWAWWKNNSFTKAAIEADKVLDQLKSEK